MDGRVEFRAEGLRRALEEAGRRATDLTPLMDIIGAQLVDAARKRIQETNTSPEGVPWPKSLRATVKGGPTLFDSGQLHDSIVSAAGPREVEVGSNLIYAAIHQFGGTIVPKSAGALTFRLANGTVVTAGRVTIPARPYLGISDEDEQLLGDVVGAWFAAPLEEGAADVV